MGNGRFEGKVISIHAPTRGATSRAVEPGQTTNISIHAPTRGATWNTQIGRVVFTISIHAPTRGATAKMHNNPYTYL